MSSMRSTASSLWILGITDTRTSISRPCTETRKRPSCGTRHSMMSSSNITLMCEITCPHSQGQPSSCSATTRPRGVGRLGQARCDTWWSADARAKVAMPLSAMQSTRAYRLGNLTKAPISRRVCFRCTTSMHRLIHRKRGQLPRCHKTFIFSRDNAPCRCPDKRSDRLVP